MDKEVIKKKLPTGWNLMTTKSMTGFFISRKTKEDVLMDMLQWAYLQGKIDASLEFSEKISGSIQKSLLTDRN